MVDIRSVSAERVAGRYSSSREWTRYLVSYSFQMSKSVSTQFMRAMSPSGDVFCGKIDLRLLARSGLLTDKKGYKVYFECQHELLKKAREGGAEAPRGNGFEDGRMTDA